MKNLLRILLLLGGISLNAQIIPSIGYMLEKDHFYPTFNVDILKGEEASGLSAAAGMADGYYALIGMYIGASEKSILNIRGGFVHDQPSLNMSFCFAPRRPVVLAMDLILSERPSMGIKLGF